MMQSAFNKEIPYTSGANATRNDTTNTRFNNNEFFSNSTTQKQQINTQGPSKQVSYYGCYNPGGFNTRKPGLFGGRVEDAQQQKVVVETNKGCGEFLNAARNDNRVINQQGNNAEANNWGRRKAVERYHRVLGPGRKVLPEIKTEAELFCEEFQIRKGPNFSSNRSGDQKNEEIIVDGGDEEWQNGNGKIRSFDECGFSPEVKELIVRSGYDDPTPIQTIVIPIVLRSKYDVLAHARTGSGKTASFMLPIVKLIQERRNRERMGVNPNSPLALIIAPTKELVSQLGDEARRFTHGTKIGVATAQGQVLYSASIRELRSGCDILVSTVGRLLHYVQKDEIQFDKLMFLVFDEADKVLSADHGGVESLKEIKDNYMRVASPNYRTMMFSATIDQLLLAYTCEFLLPNYFRVRVGELNTTALTVKQHFIKVGPFDKKERLLEFLRGHSEKVITVNGVTQLKVPKTLIFVNEKRRCDMVAIYLAIKDFRVMSINAMHSMEQRRDAVKKFTDGTYDILVGTDLVARGLNFPCISYVINFDLPWKQNANYYIHRIGRTGRLGNEGSSVSFFDCTSGDDLELLPFYIEQLERAKKEVPAWMREAQPVEDGEMAAPSLPQYIAMSSQNSRIELPKQIATSSQNIGPSNAAGTNAAGTSNAFVSPTIYGYNNNSGSNANSSGSNYEDFEHLGNDLLLVDVNDTCEFPAPDQYPKNGPIRRSHRDSMSSQENEREHFDDNSSTSIDFD